MWSSLLFIALFSTAKSLTSHTFSSQFRVLFKSVTCCPRDQKELRASHGQVWTFQIIHPVSISPSTHGSQTAAMCCEQVSEQEWCGLCPVDSSGDHQSDVLYNYAWNLEIRMAGWVLGRASGHLSSGPGSAWTHLLPGKYHGSLIWRQRFGLNPWFSAPAAH